MIQLLHVHDSDQYQVLFKQIMADCKELMINLMNFMANEV
jgi:hypothetical protein